MISLAAVLSAAAVALALSDARGRTARAMIHALPRAPELTSASRVGPAMCGLAGAAVAQHLGGWTGVVVGAGAGAGAWAAVRAAPRRARLAADRRLLQAIPLGCDLLAACVSAGASPQAATRAVAEAVPGPLADVLHGVARSLALGGSATQAWAPYADGPAALRTLAVVLCRASLSGASPAPMLDALAVDQRERQRLAGEAAARRAGVAMVAPLGLCFLPAFVLLGVVPLVAGLLGGGLDLLAG
ncbi:MAG TPA: type II secretion system F family protein [Mycobacteriales bacterium]|nr:type II secretion system F family protein [Mycobacteriales bacterium]